MISYKIYLKAFYKAIKERNYPLKAISSDITGMTWANPQFAGQYGIPLMNIPNYSTVSVAEFSLASLLLHVKKMHLTFVDRQKNKRPETRKNDVLYKKTLGIIGLGNIGIRMAELGQGMGMKVIGWNRTKKEVHGVEMVALEDIFKNSD